MTALNPVHSIGRQIGESLMLHRGMNTREARDAAIQLLQRVRIPAPEQRVDEFPHQLSGGMRQRVVIAIALACHPELIIADEPTTALDVTVQAQILSLLKDLQAEMGSSSILITHDLGVIAQSCDSVVVMYAGRVVEKAPVRELFANPRHAYTKGLLASIPQLSSVRKPNCPPFPVRWPLLRISFPDAASAKGRACPRKNSRNALPSWKYPRTTSWKPAPVAPTFNFFFYQPCRNLSCK